VAFPQEPAVDDKMVEPNKTQIFTTIDTTTKQKQKTKQQTVVSGAIVARRLLRTPFASRRHVTGIFLIN
jgi:hypothetical protein